MQFVRNICAIPSPWIDGRRALISFGDPREDVDNVRVLVRLLLIGKHLREGETHT